MRGSTDVVNLSIPWQAFLANIWNWLCLPTITRFPCYVFRLHWNTNTMSLWKPGDCEGFAIWDLNDFVSFNINLQKRNWIPNILFSVCCSDIAASDTDWGMSRKLPSDSRRAWAPFSCGLCPPALCLCIVFSVFSPLVTALHRTAETDVTLELNKNLNKVYWSRNKLAFCWLTAATLCLSGIDCLWSVRQKLYYKLHVVS